ncbi:MAG: M48 family metallopeptidase [Alphaproteobacteria bacterium]|nr:M48 family metallopeptidase [Alphaproteobacteria bacterium]
MNKIICQEQKIIIYRRLNARGLRLRLNRQGEIVLSIPFFYPKRMALSFIKDHQDWIDKQKARLKPALSFSDGQEISVLGQQLQIRHIPDAHFATHIEGNELHVSGDSAFLNRRVTDFVRAQTLSYIHQKAPELATRIGKKINRISLKDTTSRWGSCSGKKNLNFCWRLGLAPQFVLDYIIAHEVAHLAEMNHGPRFWRVVSQLTDERSTAEIWLRRHGSELR